MKLNRSRVVSLSVLGAVVIIGVAFFGLIQKGLDQRQQDRTQSIPTVSLTAPKSPPFSITTTNSSTSDSSAGEAGATLEPEKNETNQFAELLARADSGDAAAQFKAYFELSRCRGLETYSMVQSQIDVAKRVGSPFPDEYIDFLWSLHDKCASATVADFGKAAAQYLLLAQQANHPAAVALQLNEIATKQGVDAADDLALRILQSNDPAAILNTAPYLVSRRSELPPEQQKLTRSPEVLVAALNIWACHLDPESCGPWSMVMYLNCYGARLPNCDPSENYLDYLSHAVWSPDEEAEARKLAAKWQSEVQRGEPPSILPGETQ